MKKPTMKILVNILISFMMAFSAPVIHAQKGGGESVAPSGPRRHLSTIVFSGVAGAILGLSTLSFYGRPQEKLSHIAIGAAIGIIGGAMYTTYKAATEPQDFYTLREQGPRSETWALLDGERFLEKAYTPSAGLTFEF